MKLSPIEEKNSSQLDKQFYIKYNSFMITNYTRPEQILFFFENHKTGIYSTLFISEFILNNFDFTNKPIPPISLLTQINNEVSSNISKWYKTRYNKTTPKNFNRTIDDKKFLYYYQPNHVILPTPIETNKTNIHKTNKTIMPTQQKIIKTKFDINLIKEYINNSNDKNNAIKEIINITMACM